MTRALLFNIIAIAVFLLGVVSFVRYLESSAPIVVAPPNQSELSAVTVSQATSSTSSIPTTSLPTTTKVITQPSAKKASNEAIFSASTSAGEEVERIEDPYTTPPESFSDINAHVRGALVNILCEPQGYSSLNPISGSGVIVDPRGMILTNAHVAQYVLLSESPRINLSCVIRTGSPAEPTWSVVVLYIPPIWVSEHASEITDQHPTGTGEHDYALLFITGSLNGSPLPSQFPYVPIDTRPAIGFPGDQVLVGSYPAEFLGGIAAQYDLYADTSVTTIKQLLTFESSTPDVLSLGGVIEAQSGSSGGGVVNAWDRLVGIIATTSSGTTTADRDLRAIALSYINTDIAVQSGQSLNALLAGNPETEVTQFNKATAPQLIQEYVGILTSN
jgi:hypothetical protein